MVRHIALVAAALAIAIVVVGGLPGRRVERDEAKCYVNVILYGPDIVTHMNPFRMLIDFFEQRPPPPGACVPNYVIHERPASGVELRVLAGFLALCGLLAAAGKTRIATTLVVTLGLAGVVIAFVTTRAFDSPFDETTRLWPYYAVRAATAGLALAMSAWLVVYSRREMTA